jgi:hypothetical protein
MNQRTLSLERNLAGRAFLHGAKAAWMVADWPNRQDWRGYSDSTMPRMRKATGEAVLIAPRNRRSRNPYNRLYREVGHLTSVYTGIAILPDRNARLMTTGSSRWNQVAAESRLKVRSSSGRSR